ncbi:hypothetical protein CBS101457_003722 [Exobasidium rhododendri]|nr:hypothetical protein CBS101457_003722 [Exobasidium rhododendri]
MRSSRMLAAISIAANALTAGSIFCWPVFGPRIGADLGLTLTETNAIWASAVVGQYASSAFMGSISDNYGPRPLSLLAALLFGAGYFLMAKTEQSAMLSNASGASNQPHTTAFIAMAVFFVLVGAGVAASLFSALCSSSAHFKSHPGLALSIPLTLFSLSSLFLSSIASLPFFTDPETGDIDSPRWLASLGASLMIINTLSAFGLSLPAEEEDTNLSVIAVLDTSTQSNETTPLLPGPPSVVASSILAYTTPPNFQGAQDDRATAPVLTLVEFSKTRSAWVLAFVLFAAVGGSEMVMSSIGSMVYSLQSGKISPQKEEEIGREILITRTRQVQLIAIANTASRLFVGIASDLLSPSRGKRQHDKVWKDRLFNFRVSRLTLLLLGLALLGVSFGAASFTLNSIDRLWIVSIATGLGYGLIFTIVPTLIMRAWPLQFGRNFGILNYAAALGSLFFSMLFAFVNDYVATHDTRVDSVARMAMATATCKRGRRCFAPSFSVASCTLIVAFLVTLPLWKAWRRSV